MEKTPHKKRKEDGEKREKPTAHPHRREAERQASCVCWAASRCMVGWELTHLGRKRNERTDRGGVKRRKNTTVKFPRGRDG